MISKCQQIESISTNVQKKAEAYEQIMSHSNETFTNIDQLNERFLKKLATVSEPQNVRSECQNLNLNFSTTSESNIFQVVNKLNEFDNLIENLQLQQIALKNRTDILVQLLADSKETFLRNEQKVINLRKELPDLNNFSNKINNLINWKSWWHRNLPRQ